MQSSEHIGRHVRVLRNRGTELRRSFLQSSVYHCGGLVNPDATCHAITDRLRTVELGDKLNGRKLCKRNIDPGERC